MTDETDTTSEVARVLGDAQAGEMHWRRADGSMGEYAGPLRDLGHGIPRPDHGPGIRRALFDLAFGYVSGFPVRDILAYVFPGSFREAPVLEATADPQIATQAPAEQPQPSSGGNGTGGGLGERLRALGTGQTRSLRKELREIADEVDRTEEARDLHRADANSLLQQKDQWRDSANVAEAQVERVRAQLVRMTKSSDEGTRRHGSGLLRILDGEAS
jgi:hypothetical protein